MALATLFRYGSRLRRARVFHPRGRVFRGTWSPNRGATVIAEAALLQQPRHALVRLSHGVGLPRRWPDILGLAVKVLEVHGPGADQDLLMASSGRGRVARHLLRPSRSVTGTVYSTLLPYDVAGVGHRAIVACAADGSAPVTYAEAICHGPDRIPLLEIRVGGADGPLLGSLDLTGAVPQEEGEAVRFDPWNTGPELPPSGWVNRIRRPTYAASQEGRRAPAGGWRAAR